MKGKRLILLIIVGLVFLGIGLFGTYATSYAKEQRLRFAERDADRYMELLDRQIEHEMRNK